MAVMPESWTDKPLDDFRREVGRRFDQVDHRFNLNDQRFEAVDQRLDRVEAEIHSLRVEMTAELRAIRSEMAAMNRTFVQVAIGGLVTIVVGFGAMTTALVTQL